MFSSDACNKTGLFLESEKDSIEEHRLQYVGSERPLGFLGPL